MLGQDKPLQLWRDKAMVDHVLDSVPDSLPKLVSANRNLVAYGRRAPVVTDKDVTAEVLATTPGPLLGILSGLAVVKTPWLLVSPGDSPNLANNWIQTMFAAYRKDKCCVVAHDGIRQQHLHVLLHQSTAVALSNYLQQGHYQVSKWIETLNHCTAQFADPSAFRNMNEPQDLQSD